MDILVKGTIVDEFEDRAFTSRSGNRFLVKGYTIQTTGNDTLYFSTISDTVSDRKMLYKGSFVVLVLELKSNLYANKYYTSLSLKYCIQDGKTFPDVINKSYLLHCISKKSKKAKKKQLKDVELDIEEPVTVYNLPY